MRPFYRSRLLRRPVTRPMSAGKRGRAVTHGRPQGRRRRRRRRRRRVRRADEHRHRRSVRPCREEHSGAGSNSGVFAYPRRKVQSRISSRLDNDPLPLLSVFIDNMHVDDVQIDGGDTEAVVGRNLASGKEKEKGSAVVIRPTLYWRRCRATPPLKASLPCKILKCLQ